MPGPVFYAVGIPSIIVAVIIIICIALVAGGFAQSKKEGSVHGRNLITAGASISLILNMMIISGIVMLVVFGTVSAKIGSTVIADTASKTLRESREDIEGIATHFSKEAQETARVVDGTSVSINTSNPSHGPMSNPLYDSPKRSFNNKPSKYSSANQPDIYHTKHIQHLIGPEYERTISTY